MKRLGFGLLLLFTVYGLSIQAQPEAFEIESTEQTLPTELPEDSVSQAGKIVQAP